MMLLEKRNHDKDVLVFDFGVLCIQFDWLFNGVSYYLPFRELLEFFIPINITALFISILIVSYYTYKCPMIDLQKTIQISNQKLGKILEE